MANVRFNDKDLINTLDISSDDIIPITDIDDMSDDKKINLGQLKTFCATDISGKQNLITAPTNNNLVTTDALGQTKDSGIASSSLANITNQGNTFNGSSQLVQLNSSGQLPILDGSLLTGTDKIPFALNSGYFDANGNADLLAGTTSTTLTFKVDNNVSYKPLSLTYADKSQETLTSLTSVTGLSTNGSYTIVKEKAGNPTSIPTPTYNKDLLVDFSQGNANDNYVLHTPTVIGSPTYTGNKFNSNGTSGLSYPITSLGSGTWCIQGLFKSTNLTTIQTLWDTNNTYHAQLNKTTGNKLQISLSSNNTSYNIANAVEGTKADWSASVEYFIRTRFTGTQYLVDWSTDGINWTNDITITSSLVVYSPFASIYFGCSFASNAPIIGTMDNLQITVGQSVVQTKNQVTQGKTYPLYPIDGDYHCLTATGLQTYKRVAGSWVETQYVPMGTATVASNVISAVSTQPYNQNGINELRFSWISPEYTITSATAININHNLNIVNPKDAIYTPIIVCKIASDGYSVGDILIGPFVGYNYGGGITANLPVIPSSNSVLQLTGTAGGGIFISNKSMTNYIPYANLSANFKYMLKINY